MMNKVWIVVASKTIVKIFEQESPRDELKKIRELCNPAARAKSQDITGRGSRRRELAGDAFARQVASLLEDGRNRGHYREVVLVAEPHFLGRVKTLLSRGVRRAVVANFRKDLAHAPDRGLCRRLTAMLPSLWQDPKRWDAAAALA